MEMTLERFLLFLAGVVVFVVFLLILLKVLDRL